MDTQSNQNQTTNEVNPHFEKQVLETGVSVFKQAEKEGASLFNKDWWYGRVMDWSMKNEHFKTQMFRFVDVLPYLDSGSEVARHLKEYFAEKGGDLPSIFNFGVGIGSLAPGLLAGAVKKNVTQMAKMFITGETPEAALPAIKKARKNSLCCTVDLLGEATLSEAEALEYQKRYSDLIDKLSDDSKTWSTNDQMDVSALGAIPRVNVSVKLTSLYSQIRETAWEDTKDKLKERLRPLFRQAMSRNVFINIDMEQYSHKDLTIEVFMEVIAEEEFATYPHWGIVVQAYLRDSLADAKKLAAFAKKRGVPFTIRLVKGAYWDYETIHADQHGWPVPVYTNKAESDKNYEDCSRELINSYPHICLALGSHNVRSISAALVMAEEKGLPKNALEIQMLYGMAEPIKRSFVRAGYRVREYATVGELIPGMAYLVRRLLENTSNESFLKSKFVDGEKTEALLKNPAERLKSVIFNKSKTTKTSETQEPFKNEPLCDFALEEPRKKMTDALTKVEKILGETVSPMISGAEVSQQDTYTRTNPSDTDQVVSVVGLATQEIAEQAVTEAQKAYPAWRATDIEQRAQLVDKLAQLILDNRYELSAIEVYEVGKTWKEADGDICEAVDFCRYYARQMREHKTPFRVGGAKGEVSLYSHIPRGVCAVIAPWNFPLAILTGMVSAALVTGNTVVMKPAEQSSLVAKRLMQLILKAGFPKGVVQFVPGRGEVVGDYLTSHPQIPLIAFTGSREVGLNIVGKMPQIGENQHYVKKCIIEMGGKNAIIIDSDADLDEAVSGVLYSAFGFQGQKCSACSRVIVLESIYDRFAERLVEAAKSLDVMNSKLPESSMGPVVDEDAYNKINGFIQRASQKYDVLLSNQVKSTSGKGWYVSPTIFGPVDSTDEIAQDEIFGPVVALIKVKTLDEALNALNSTQFALTGGIYSRSPANLERAKQEALVGNFYVNRSITGALVERHPFGGFKMSGLGSKTGGPDYLKQYMDPRVVTENTMRRGFAPEDNI